MRTKAKNRNYGFLLILMGIAGIVFICSFDILVGKPVNDISGPKSISVFILSAIFIIAGVVSILKK